MTDRRYDLKRGADGALRWLVAALALLVLAGVPGLAGAYPEFQMWVQQNSGRNVNCAMCHMHPDGPEGVKPGQIGSLNAEELQRLNQARAAFEPGQPIDNPILNEFGDEIIHQLGKTKFLTLRQNPERLAAALNPASDLDGDGLPDAREYREGTHPLDPNHGNPWALFVNKATALRFHIIMLALATVLGLFGLNNLLRWFDRLSQMAKLKESSANIESD